MAHNERKGNTALWLLRQLMDLIDRRNRDNADIIVSERAKHKDPFTCNWIE
ncbi:MAG: hypothetical protein QXI32_02075 [Candidatus Bathyarchaeia archaeon]